ncbi:ABC transporter ATP-binding protein [Pleomorphomonas koreensis]|uniref:ABC transporter ATP-binding protein n=1 Tax=Pleomorphomonas koreensis TaxID=257440 RepID=UPI000426A939|nr:ABC transporter ATP-binding protein [Pleomorphomonas koreensis]
MSFIEISHLRKSFGANTVVHDFDLSIDKGEFVSFLGPSGCGKTTILRMIAGFETASAGAIQIGGTEVTHLPPSRRKVGMVFQAYALFPNLTVAGNIGFGLKIAGKDKGEIDARVAEMLELIKLPDLGSRYPYQLSGGQQQRVALARALAVKPEVLLLDEPLSALDAKIRVSLREEIRALQRDLGITTVFVTHDQEEALSISDRIVVMNEGRADQIGTPSDIYNNPATRFVASFVGTLNLLEARVVDPAAGRLSIDGQPVMTTRDLSAFGIADETTVALRPEALTLGDGNGDRNTLSGTVEEVAFLGAVIRVRVRLSEARLSLDLFNDPALQLPRIGAPAAISFKREDLLVMDRR